MQTIGRLGFISLYNGKKSSLRGTVSQKTPCIFLRNLILTYKLWSTWGKVDFKNLTIKLIEPEYKMQRSRFEKKNFFTDVALSHCLY